MVEGPSQRCMRHRCGVPHALLLAVGLSSGVAVGCGDSQPPPPGADGGLDGGFRDAGTQDGAMDTAMPPEDAGADSEVANDLGVGADGGGQDGGTDDSGQPDAGAEDSGTPVGEAPVIANIAWTVAQDGSCAPGSGIRFSVVVTDADTIAFFLTPTVMGMGACFLADVDSATDMVDVTLTNCPHDQDYTPTVTLTDPEGNSVSVSGFTVMPCTNGAHFP